jgi:hypothetical protein
MDKVWTATMDDTQKPYGQPNFTTYAFRRLTITKSTPYRDFEIRIRFKKHRFYMDKLFSRRRNSPIKEEINRYLVITINLS